MNIPDAPLSTRLTQPATPSRNHGLPVILFVALLLLTATAFESLRFFHPVTLYGGKTLQLQQLPDGSKVRLETGSQVSLGNEWNRKSLRELWLQGGGLFAVLLQADTTSLTIHLSHFDVLVQNATLYCSNKKTGGYAWLKEGNASILTHESKQKRLPFKPGTCMKWDGRQLSLEAAPNQVPAE